MPAVVRVKQMVNVLAHLEQDQPSLQADQEWLTWHLVGKGLRQTTGNLLGVTAPLAPYMVKQLFCQLHCHVS